MYLNKENLIVNPHSDSIGLPSPQKFVTVVHGSFYETARTCSEPRSVERRLSFAVEVATASGN